ncbi:MAG: OB-fold nucleic acid binding domain-containing protein, partial [Candidatus Caldarchaeum sp.]
MDESVRMALRGRVLAGDVKPELDGKGVNLFGWVHEIRDLGKLVFILLRDVSGICQVVFRMEEVEQSVRDAVRGLTNESAVFVEGVVVKQPRSKLGVEVVGKRLTVLGRAVPKLELDP